jgi:tetratricopeptide (TPR) repeat protein
VTPARECLAGQLDSLAALAQLARTVRRDHLEKLVDASMQLPDPGQCVDPVHLAGRPTIDPEDRDAARAIERELGALLMGSTLTADIEPAAVDALVERAKALDEPSLHARLLLGRGALEKDRGDYEGARADLERALALALADASDDLAIEIAARLAYVCGLRLEKFDAALAYAALAEALLDRRRATPTDPRRGALFTDLAGIYRGLGRRDEALAAARSSLELREAELPDDHPDLAESWEAVGSAQRALGHFDEAFAAHQEALRIRERVYGSEHPRVATSLANVGVAAYSRGDYGTSEAHHRRALALREKLLGPEHDDVATSLDSLGGVLAAQGRHDEGLALKQRSLEIRKKALGPTHGDVAISEHNIGGVLMRLGRTQEAIAASERAVAGFEASYGPQHAYVGLALLQLAEAHLLSGDAEQALLAIERAVAAAIAGNGAEHPDTATAYSTRGRIFAALERYEDAREDLEHALRIYVEHDDLDPTYRVDTAVALTRLPTTSRQEAMALLEAADRGLGDSPEHQALRARLDGARPTAPP